MSYMNVKKEVSYFIYLDGGANSPVGLGPVLKLKHNNIPLWY